MLIVYNNNAEDEDADSVLFVAFNCWNIDTIYAFTASLFRFVEQFDFTLFCDMASY